MIRSTSLAPLAALILLAGCATETGGPQKPPPPAPSSPIADLASIAAAVPCRTLATIDMAGIGGAGSKITAATVMKDGDIEVCEVTGTLAPAVGFRVTLPTRAWTQRYLQIGCGGLCGNISRNAPAAAGCVPLAAGAFVIASTDMGHQGDGAEFGDDPQRRADFAYRGQHLTALAAKKLIAAFYGKAERYAYFSGCSDGGREALIAAQRYPEDFDGIIAGAPALNFQVQNSLYHAWQYRSNLGADGKAILVADRLPILHKAVLSQCDKLDRLEDGLIADPRLCKVNLAPVTCKKGEADISNCLTAAEAAAARKLYDGPVDAKTKARLTLGGPQPGSELAWAGVFAPSSAEAPSFSRIIAEGAMRHVIFDKDQGPDFDLMKVRFDQATFDRLKANHPLYDATNPDLSAFQAAGGKLILWHGWSDPHISPINTIAYHEAVEAVMGAEKAAVFERLYLLPGVYHCTGGEGPSSIDMLTPMMSWVEMGLAPQAIPARKPPSMMTRPLYPFPAVARFVAGDPNQANSFTAGQRLVPTGTPKWAGAEFFKPYKAPN